MGRVYKVVPTIAAVTNNTTEQVLLFQAADDKPYHIRSIMVSQKGNSDNEEWAVNLREHATPGGGDSVSTVEPVDGNDSSFSGTIVSDNGTDITGTPGNSLARVAGHVQAPIQLVPTEINGSLGRVEQTRAMVLEVEAPATSNVTPIVTVTLEEV